MARIGNAARVQQLSLDVPHQDQECGAQNSDDAVNALSDDGSSTQEDVDADPTLLDELGDQHHRPKTMSRREMMREARRRERRGERLQVVDYPRPQTRKECENGPRPCLFVACKHHLYLDVNPETGSIKLNFPDKDVWDLPETCALDVAQRGGVTLEEVGELLNLTRERVRQVEVAGLTKLRDRSSLAELDAFLGWDPDSDRE